MEVNPLSTRPRKRHHWVNAVELMADLQPEKHEVLPEVLRSNQQQKTQKLKNKQIQPSK